MLCSIHHSPSHDDAWTKDAKKKGEALAPCDFACAQSEEQKSLCLDFVLHGGEERKGRGACHMGVWGIY